jgi:hypothetical protein
VPRATVDSAADGAERLLALARAGNPATTVYPGRMQRYEDEFDLLFPSVDLTTAELARDVLIDGRIPAMLRSRGVDADATLGVGVRHQLFVAKCAAASARNVLNAAWGNGAAEKLESRV